MADLPGFSASEQAPPPSRRELQRRDKEMRALAVWYDTQSESAVKKALGCANLHEARVLINRGVERYESDKLAMIGRLKVRQQMDLDAIRAGWIETAGTDRSSAEMIFKQQEREGKLQGLDAQKDTDGGTHYTIITGHEMLGDLPGKLTVIQGGVIEGEVVEQKALEPGEGDV